MMPLVIGVLKKCSFCDHVPSMHIQKQLSLFLVARQLCSIPTEYSCNNVNITGASELERVNTQSGTGRFQTIDQIFPVRSKSDLRCAPKS